MLLKVGSTVVALEVDDAELGGWLARLFADMAATADEPPHHRLRLITSADPMVFSADGEAVYRGTNAANVIDHVVSWCNRAAIASRPECVNIHAAAVVPPRSERCVVVPGAPGAGKSSLAVAAMEAGWGYLSDEMASLDAGGVVQRYAKPITVKRGGLDLADHDWDPATISQPQTRWYVRPEALGGHLGSPARPAAFVFVSYEPGAETGVQHLSPARSLAELGVNCQDDLDDHGIALMRLAGAVSDAHSVALVQSDVTSALQVIEQLAVLPVEAHSAPVLLTAPRSPSKARGPRTVPDAVAIVLGGGMVVHHPPTQALLGLDPVAAAIWPLLDGSVTTAEVVAELADVFDHAPREIADDLSTLLDDFRSHGLIVDPE